MLDLETAVTVCNIIKDGDFCTCGKKELDLYICANVIVTDIATEEQRTVLSFGENEQITGVKRRFN